MSFALLLLAAVGAGASTPPAATLLVGESPPSATAVADTVFQARRGDLLVVQNLAGRVSVRVQGESEVRVEVRRSGDAAIALVREGDRIVLNARDGRGRRRTRDLEISVPSWLDVDLRGGDLDVEVVGLRSSVNVTNIEGEIDIRDIEGRVTVGTVEGRIRVTDVRGSVRARSVDASVHLLRVAGSIIVESTDGDVILDDVDAMEVDAQTVGGDVEFDGWIREGGAYTLITHDGHLTAAIPEGTEARVSVSTFDGSFEAGFPILLDRFRGGREMRFTLGAGGASLTLQAFDGDIVLEYRR